MTTAPAEKLTANHIYASVKVHGEHKVSTAWTLIGNLNLKQQVSKSPNPADVQTANKLLTYSCVEIGIEVGINNNRIEIRVEIDVQTWVTNKWRVRWRFNDHYLRAYKFHER